MQNPHGNFHYLENVRYFISPSEFYIDIFSKSFGRKNRDILLLGYPRNDFLFEETDCLTKLGINCSGQKIITYLPTFRKPKNGGYSDSNCDIYIDGIINFSEKESLEMWNRTLSDAGIILIVKPHPSAASFPQKSSYSNIVILNHNELLNKDIQLYHILHYSDALLTDYSSVFCDYLTLNRPIGFILDDVEEYQSSRGFVMENVLDFLPGQKIFNKEGLLKFFADISNDQDSTEELRATLSKMYVQYCDDKNCERLWNRILELK